MVKTWLGGFVDRRKRKEQEEEYEAKRSKLEKLAAELGMKVAG